MSSKHKKEYTTDIPILIGIGIAFLIFATLSVVPPISIVFQSIGAWFSVLAALCFFPGFIMIAIAIGVTYQNKHLKQTVKRAVNSGDYGNRVNLEAIAGDFDLSHGDMRRLLTDLRMEGELKVSFDSTTGEVVFPMLGTSQKGSGASSVTNGHIYCSYCGLQLSKDSLYCPGCGANLH